MTALLPVLLRPARIPRYPLDSARLLITDRAARTVRDGSTTALAEALRPGDLLVVNDAATLPASLPGTAHGQAVELRLISTAPFRAIVFGAGDWRTPTEHRPAPPSLTTGDTIVFDGLVATVTRVERPRGIELAFDRAGAALWAALYRIGRPIQYSHLRQDLALWDVQTTYGGEPWALELPSAGRPLSGAVQARLRQRGVCLTAITHAAGLSATGDDSLDAALPLPERGRVTASAITAIAACRARGGRVIAVGTSVVRSLEGNAARHGSLVAEDAVTDHRLGPGSPLRVVDGLLTGMHEPTASHYQLLRAFLDTELLDRTYAAARGLGYQGHEFGDLNLIL